MATATKTIDVLIAEIDALPLADKVEALNAARKALHAISPFQDEPVDCVQWVKSEHVGANDYNPNSVAPPEMELLALSIDADGYTQPVVSWEIEDGKYEVVDGFHRTRCGKEVPRIAKRVHGYIPLAIIQSKRTSRNDRMASTIRHNRARGKHAVSAMSDIVIELKRRNWSDQRISKELGMDQDEILRLCQITGLAELFTDTEFSKSWDVEGCVVPEDFEELTDDIETYGDETKAFRTVNTSDENRVFHTYDKWECQAAGLYATCMDGKKKPECEQEFANFLTDLDAFERSLKHVTKNWKHSCEHYLTNAAMNRLAWLGQAACCHATGIPAVFRGGWFLLSESEQDAANEIALKYLNKWLKANGREPVAMDEAIPDRQAEIY